MSNQDKTSDSMIISLSDAANDASVSNFLPNSVHLLLSKKMPMTPGFIVVPKASKLFDGNQNLSKLYIQLDAAVQQLRKDISQVRDQHIPFLLSVTPLTIHPNPHIIYPINYIGLSPDLVLLLAQLSNPQFAFEAYVSLWQTFGHQVFNLPASDIADIVDRLVIQLQAEPTLQNLSVLLREIGEKTNQQIPHIVEEQLRLAVTSLYESWQRYIGPKQIGQDDIFSLAILVQVTVMGNNNSRSGCGVVYNRNPVSGLKQIHGQFFPAAHFEEAFSGAARAFAMDYLRVNYSTLYSRLTMIMESLEGTLRSLFEIRFLVESERLYISEVIDAKCSDEAAIRVAVGLASDGIIDKNEAIRRVDPITLQRAIYPQLIENNDKLSIIAQGIPAAPGVVSGIVVFDAREAQQRAGKGESVILVRRETFPQDLAAIQAAQGLLTAKGGITSHAAVIARGLGKACIVGVSSLVIDDTNSFAQLGSYKIMNGDVISIDGSNGYVILGRVDVVKPDLNEDIITLLSWCDEVRMLGIRANVDLPDEAAFARSAGAEGIGLCRVEHLCAQSEHLRLLQQIILSQDKDVQRHCLDKLEVLLRDDIKAIYTAMSGYPVTIRLLDPPLREFLPFDIIESYDLKQTFKVNIDRLTELYETNPMMGLRGCRLNIVLPELLDTQVKAILSAATLAIREGYVVLPEIMIPFVVDAAEIRWVVKRVHEIANLIADVSTSLHYKIGAMIETPRAVLMADQIAPYVSFFSFGTNDLTQLTMGISRDDSSFLTHYLEQNIFQFDPFTSIDREGVGEFMQEAIRRGRLVSPELTIGVCGEHSSDPRSIALFNDMGLSYLSCVPTQIPIVQLCAAKAALQHGIG